VYCIRPITTLLGRCLPHRDGLALAAVDLHAVEEVAHPGEPTCRATVRRRIEPAPRTLVEMHTLCTLSRSRLPARTARIVLPVTSPGTAGAPQVESGMRYQVSSSPILSTNWTFSLPPYPHSYPQDSRERAYRSWARLAPDGLCSGMERRGPNLLSDRWTR
jgi:hypothetical protein